ncbi:alpha-amylase family protein [Alteromonas sp. CYL-A6]|uniref:alpha-amylase family protein n=1 Tax=Alteromonas nitratireducens TaxID=3390813 RepID=UPI0034BF4ED6
MRHLASFLRSPTAIALAVSALTITACFPVTEPSGQADSGIAPHNNKPHVGAGKPVVYQVFTRLFGNTNTTNKPWGTLEENGVGKFNDFTDTALAAIREMGVTHIWYTGVPHHAVVTDYTRFGISQDDPDVVKGRAGSPYAVKDYYSVNPDLAVDPARRLEEFDALVERTHAHGMKVIIDIVPNHVARRYESLAAPAGIQDFGAGDDTSVAYARDNNFYYVPGEALTVPGSEQTPVLGGDPHPLADGKFEEDPAKWTGNGARSASPSEYDWYETVKINYGVRPDGHYDFPLLPEEYAGLPVEAHVEFWAGKTLPDSWYKFRDIAFYWLDRGVDGFRFDMAEMVPVEFWSFLNSAIKQKSPDAFLLAEVYQPQLYRDYLQRGKMDYLYDKVGFYDTLKGVMQGRQTVSELLTSHARVSDIAPAMLHFLENHDEQRIASDAFAGDARMGKPAMAVSALISPSPIMLYFGQEVGEDASEDMGFGDPTRTTIFDYAGVPAHQRWMNGGKFDGGALSTEENALRRFYVGLLNIAALHPAVTGTLIPLHEDSLAGNSSYSEAQLAFVRTEGDKRLLVMANFSPTPVKAMKIVLSTDILGALRVTGSTVFTPLLTPESGVSLRWLDGDDSDTMTLEVSLPGMEAAIYEF